MAHDDPVTPAFPTLSPEERHSLRRRVEANLAQIKRCQVGDHCLEVTKSPGVLVCQVCHIVGACLWCGVIPPQGAVIVICSAHRDFVRLQAMALGIPLSMLPTVSFPAATSAAETPAKEEE
jgi:hypothetical protein